MEWSTWIVIPLVLFAYWRGHVHGQVIANQRWLAMMRNAGEDHDG